MFRRWENINLSATQAGGLLLTRRSVDATPNEEKMKISLFKELHYWMYFYSSLIAPKGRDKFFLFLGAKTFRIGLGLLNFISVWIFVEYLLTSIGFKFTRNVLGNLLFIFFLFEFIFIPFNIDSIIKICEQFPKKRRITGQIKLWVYVVFTIVFFWCVDKFFH